MPSGRLRLSNPSSRRRKITLTIILLVLTGIVGYHTSNYAHKYFKSLLDFRKQRNILINLTNFYYRYNPKEICSQRFKNQLTNNIIGVVHSSRENFISRAIIRRTHGSVSAYKGWHIQIVFVLGIGRTTEEEMIEGLLQRESNKYGDLIVGNFEDSYHNLSYKHVMGYKWASEFCPEANYYLKSDDDVVVNIFFAINFLAGDGANKTEKYDKDKDYYCYIYAGTKPERNRNKWYVSHEEYSKIYYPEYCGYGSYLVPIGTVRKIVAVSSDAGFLWVDDVFVSGVLRERANENEKIPANAIKIRSGASHYQGFDKNITSTEVLKKMLGIIEEQRSPAISCHLWISIVEAYEVMDIYITACHELL